MTYRVNHSAAKTELLKYRIRIFHRMPLLKNVWRLYINPERRSVRCAVIGKTGKTAVLPISGGYRSKTFSLSCHSITVGLVWLKLMMAPLSWVWRSPMQWTVTIEEANISVSSLYRCTIQGRKRNVKKSFLSPCCRTANFSKLINQSESRKVCFNKKCIITVYKPQVYCIVIDEICFCFQIFINHNKTNISYFRINLKRLLWAGASPQ